MRSKLTRVALLIFVIAVLVAPGATVYGDNPLVNEKTTIVRVYYPDLATANRVLISFEAQLLETNYAEGYHVLEVTPQEIGKLAAAGLRVQKDDAWKAPSVGLESIPNYACYRTVEETYAAAQALATSHPTLATWTDVGDSWQKTQSLGGYDLGLLLLTNSAIAGPKPKLFLTAAMHAREYATAELVTRFAEYLVNNYGSDADATWILDHHEVHLMLQSNPDGRKKAETGLSWRKNTDQNYCGPTSNYRGADLNRNFEFEWGCCGGSSTLPCDLTYRGPSAASEPETQVVQKYLDAIFPDVRGPNLTDPAPADTSGVYIDIHSYGQLVLWPWGFTSTTPPNAAALQTLGRKFAYWNSHTPQQAIGLYPTDGTSDDYAYGELGVAAYCIEVGTAFFQSCTYFQNTLWPANLPTLLYAAKVVRTPYLTASGPDTTNLALSGNAAPPGAAVNLSATINDTRYNNTNGTEPTQAIAAAEYYVDTPPWVAGAVAISMAASDGAFNASIENVSAAVNTASLSEGKHTLFVRGRDANNNWGALTAIFLTISSASNQPPAAAFTWAATNLACTFDGSSSSDPDGSIASYAWSFGDGSTGSGPTASHTYATAGTYNVVLTVVDNAGASDTETKAVPVSAPKVYVYDITMSGSDSAGSHTAKAVVTIYNNSGSPISGAVVSAAWSGAYNKNVSGTTGANGTVTFTSGAVRKHNLTFTFKVKGVTKSGYAYDPTLNVKTSASIVVP